MKRFYDVYAGWNEDAEFGVDPDFEARFETREEAEQYGRKHFLYGTRYFIVKEVVEPWE